jgi:hypothetical protein
MLYLRRARCSQISVGTLMRAMDVRRAILTKKKRKMSKKVTLRCI